MFVVFTVDIRFLSYECKTGNENDQSCKCMLCSNVTRHDESLYVHGTNNLKLTVCLVNAYKKTVCSMCDWCQLVKPACTHSLCRHVIGVGMFKRVLFACV